MSYPRLLAALSILAVALCHAQETSADEIASTPSFQAFIHAYIAAVNSKDPEKFKELVHPESLKAMRKKNSWFESRFDVAPIPAKYRLFVYSIAPGSPLSFSQVARVPLRPTHKFQLSFDTAPDNEAGEIGWIIFENGRWYEIIPDKL